MEQTKTQSWRLVLGRMMVALVMLGMLAGPPIAAWAAGWDGGHLGAVGYIVLGLLTVVAALGWGLVMALARPTAAPATPAPAVVQPMRWKEPAGDARMRRRVELRRAHTTLTTVERLAAG